MSNQLNPKLQAELENILEKQGITTPVQDLGRLAFLVFMLWAGYKVIKGVKQMDLIDKIIQAKSIDELMAIWKSDEFKKSSLFPGQALSFKYLELKLIAIEARLDKLEEK